MGVFFGPGVSEGNHRYCIVSRAGIEPAAKGQVALQLFEYAFLFVELLSTTDLSNAIPPLKM